MPQPNYNIITFDFHSKWEINEAFPNYLNHLYWIDIFIDGVDLKQLVIGYTNKYFKDEEIFDKHIDFIKSEEKDLDFVWLAVDCYAEENNQTKTKDINFNH